MTKSKDKTQQPDPLAVSPEFIEENKVANLVKPSKKFAPYTKAQRRKRRMEVYRLHFEQGWPAVRIAAAMGVDKNTINNDLKILYDRALDEYNPNNMKLEDYTIKQIFRLETQRDRLGGYLADAKDVETKISIERLIEDIDFRLLNAISKTTTDHLRFWDAVIERVNALAEKEGWTDRFTSVTELYKISLDSRKRLSKVREEAGLT